MSDRDAEGRRAEGTAQYRRDMREDRSVSGLPSGLTGPLIVAGLALALLSGCDRLMQFGPGEQAEVEMGAILECRELGGGWVYERFEGGGFHVGLGRSDPSGDVTGGAPPPGMTIDESIRARRANGWTDELLEVLGPDTYEDAVDGDLFDGSREQFRQRKEASQELLAQMPVCDGTTSTP